MCCAAEIVDRDPRIGAPSSRYCVIHVGRHEAHRLAAGDKRAQFIGSVLATTNHDHLVADTQVHLETRGGEAARG